MKEKTFAIYIAIIIIVIIPFLMYFFGNFDIRLIEREGKGFDSYHRYVKYTFDKKIFVQTGFGYFEINYKTTTLPSKSCSISLKPCPNNQITGCTRNQSKYYHLVCVHPEYMPKGNSVGFNYTEQIGIDELDEWKRRGFNFEYPTETNPVLEINPRFIE